MLLARVSAKNPKLSPGGGLGCQHSCAGALLAGRAPGLGPLAQLAASISQAAGRAVTARLFTLPLVMVAALSPPVAPLALPFSPPVLPPQPLHMPLVLQRAPCPAPPAPAGTKLLCVGLAGHFQAVCPHHTPRLSPHAPANEDPPSSKKSRLPSRSPRHFIHSAAIKEKK